eukprot:186880_1
MAGESLSSGQRKQMVAALCVGFGLLMFGIYQHVHADRSTGRSTSTPKREKRKRKKRAKESPESKSPEAPVDPTRVRAEELKVMGNELFKAKQVREAIILYTKAIELHEDPSYYGNRALAFIQQDEFALALDDAMSMYRVDPSSVKALHLRAISLQGLGRIAEAALAFQDILVKDPNNAKAKLRLKECEAVLSADDSKDDSNIVEDSNEIKSTESIRGISEEYVVISEEPVVVSEEPIAVSEDHIVISEEPIAVSKEPIAVIDEPLVPSEEPVVESNAPVAIPEESPVITEQPLAISEESIPEPFCEPVNVEEPIFPEPLVSDELAADEHFDDFDSDLFSAEQAMDDLARDADGQPHDIEESFIADSATLDAITSQDVMVPAAVSAVFSEEKVPAEKPTTSQESVEKPITSEESVEKPVASEESVEQPITSEEPVQKPIASEEPLVSEEPVASIEPDAIDIDKSANPSVSLGVDISSSDDQADQSIQAADNVDDLYELDAEFIAQKPVAFEESVKKPIAFEEPVEKPIASDELGEKSTEDLIASLELVVSEEPADESIAYAPLVESDDDSLEFETAEEASSEEPIASLKPIASTMEDNEPISPSTVDSSDLDGAKSEVPADEISTKWAHPASLNVNESTIFANSAISHPASVESPPASVESVSSDELSFDSPVEFFSPELKSNEVESFVGAKDLETDQLSLSDSEDESQKI